MPPPNHPQEKPQPPPPSDTSEFTAALRAHRLSAAVRSPAPPSTIPVDLQAAARAPDESAAAAAPPQPIHNIACMVTHGMGQQVPFQTCAQIAEAFVRGNRQPSSIRPDRLQLVTGGDLLACVKLVFDATATQPETHVDIFEGYWAPLTEGKISFTATILFLVQTFISGLKSCIVKHKSHGNRTGSRGVFTRWVFGALREFAIKKRTFSHLIWVGVVLAITVAIAYGCEQILAHAWTALKPLLTWNHPAAAIATLWHKFWAHLGRNILRILALAAAAFYAYWFRYAVVEFVGDVVIYVSSFKVSLYEEVRDAIQKTVIDVGKQIAAANLPPTPLDGPYDIYAQPRYDGLIFVGHSLGSVISYDLINALIVWDATGCQGRHNVASRIRRFITFGSPLDKTAFLFRTQFKEEHDYREALAGLMQPLILDYHFRSFPWVNLHSHLDPISGSLAYYDLPDDQKPNPPVGDQFVENKIDPGPWIPLWAHTQYWDKPALTAELLDALP